MKKTLSSSNFRNQGTTDLLIKPNKTREKDFPGLQDTFESAMDIIALISENLDILKINKAGYKNLGKKPAEVLGKKCYKVIHGLNAPIPGCACKLAKKTGEGTESEIFDRGRYYLTTAAPIYDKNKKFVAFTHTVKDITELKKTEKSLKTENNMLERAIQKRTLDLLKTNEKLKQEISERKKSEEALKKSKDELQKQRKALKQKNSALNEIIAQIEKEKEKIKDNIITNIDRIIYPTLEKLHFQEDSEIYIRLLKTQLKDITSQYATKITQNHFKLTPREIELCNFIKSGLSSKEIANLLNISFTTVNKHRRNVRKKLDLTKSEINLATYLLESI